MEDEDYPRRPKPSKPKKPSPAASTPPSAATAEDPIIAAGAPRPELRIKVPDEDSGAREASKKKAPCAADAALPGALPAPVPVSASGAGTFEVVTVTDIESLYKTYHPEASSSGSGGAALPSSSSGAGTFEVVTVTDIESLSRVYHPEASSSDYEALKRESKERDIEYQKTKYFDPRKLFQRFENDSITPDQKKLVTIANYLAIHGPCTAAAYSKSDDNTIVFTYNSRLDRKELKKLDKLAEVARNGEVDDIIFQYLCHNVHFRKSLKSMRGIANHEDQTLYKKLVALSIAIADRDNLGKLAVEIYTDAISYLTCVDASLYNAYDHFVRPFVDAHKIKEYFSDPNLELEPLVKDDPYIHAELHLFKYGEINQEFIGTSILCCPHCYDALKSAGVEVLGSHGISDKSALESLYHYLQSIEPVDKFAEKYVQDAPKVKPEDFRGRTGETSPKSLEYLDQLRAAAALYETCAQSYQEFLEQYPDCNFEEFLDIYLSGNLSYEYYEL